MVNYNRCMSTLSTITAVIDALGGTVAAAKLTGRKKSAVSMWKARDRFPDEVELYLLITKELKRNGHTVSRTLWGKSLPKEEAA
jgi:hypothetical protein